MENTVVMPVSTTTMIQSKAVGVTVGWAGTGIGLVGPALIDGGKRKETSGLVCRYRIGAAALTRPPSHERILTKSRASHVYDCCQAPLY